MLLMLLCLIGGIGTLLPWFDVRFTKNLVGSGTAVADGVLANGDYVFCQDAAVADSGKLMNTAGIPWDPSELYQTSGVDLQTGIMTVAIFGLLGLLRLLVPRLYQASIAVNAAAAILAMFGLVAILFARIEIQQVKFRFPAEMVSVAIGNPGYASRVGDTSNNLHGSKYLTCMYQAEASETFEDLHPDYRQHITMQPGYFVSLGIASLVLILSGSVLRQRLFGEQDQHNPTPPRADVATLTIEDVRKDRLPDLCVVCGKQASDRVRRKLQYQSKNAQGLMMLGFILGGIPGVIIAILTQKETPIACPVCPEHRNHWNRLILFASIGWLIPFLTGGTSFLLGFLATNSSVQPSNLAITGLVFGIVFGLLVYLVPVIYLACTQVKCEQTSDDQITFSRVASPFARSVRGLRKT